MGFVGDSGGFRGRFGVSGGTMEWRKVRWVERGTFVAVALWLVLVPVLSASTLRPLARVGSGLDSGAGLDLDLESVSASGSALRSSGPSWADKQVILGFRGFSPQSGRSGTASCSRFPEVCASSPAGSDCCRNKCTNVASDDKNCGNCGTVCCAGSQCCGGFCADIARDPRNCGGCGIRCRWSERCSFGLCNYASQDDSNY